MAAKPAVLVIDEAKWGCVARHTDEISVTQVLSKLAVERGGGRFLYIPRAEKKTDLLGNPWPKAEKDLWIRYTYQGESKTQAFHQDQEVFIGDIDYCYQSQIDQFGYVEDVVADALLFRYRPILHLHPQETSYPARVDWYLPQVGLFLHVNGKQFCILDKVSATDALIRSDQQGTYTFHTREKRRYFLKHIDSDSVRNGEGPKKLPQVPYYCTCSVTEDGDICLSYFFFYAYNGPIMESPLVPAVVRAIAGTHQGDWEYVAVRISPDGENIRAVHMSRHAGVEGKWYLASCPDLARDAGWHIDPDQKRLVIYAGCESHANYNIPGGQDRGHGGFVDDKTGNGAVWDPNHIVNIGSIAHPRVPWVRFAGLWGKSKLEGEGPEGPVLKAAFFGRTYPMTQSNCIPAFGSWWTDVKKESDVRIDLIKKGTRSAPNAIPVLPISSLADDQPDLSSGAYAAIPVPEATSASPLQESNNTRDIFLPSDPTPTARQFFGPGAVAGQDYTPPPSKIKRGDLLDSSSDDAEAMLKQDSYIVSQNGEYHLWMQSDGNLVLYQKHNGGSVVWTSKSKGYGMPPYQLSCQGDGNTVIYDANSKAIWKTDTFDKSRKGPYHFVVQNDRNLVLYDRINRPVWAAGSHREKPTDYGKLLK